MGKAVIIGAAIAAIVAGTAPPVSADPPPWAPAYGYRAKHDDEHKEKYKHKRKRDNDDDQYARAYVPPFDIGLGRCNRDVLGGLIGGASGGAIGSTIGKGDGRTAAIIGGAIIGIIVGGSIGRSMDAVDQNCVGQALEHAPDGSTIVWQNPQGGAQYQVVPTRTVQASDGRYCREYTTTAVVAGNTQRVYGRACRQPDGSWQIQS
jgi:surface antigen